MNELVKTIQQLAKAQGKTREYVESRRRLA